ncbi:MAG: hypothetical protein KJ950_10905 [Proteobacteria bacterium]|nr:hypothetical protein [Pseudomonadota bacterium]MBU1687839.1 hypothetical protein [Pseudomonadota bacterium]
MRKTNPGQLRIIRDNTTLRSLYPQLGSGDLFIGRLRLKQTEEYFLLDLQARGVTIFPSPLAQMISRSKAMQTDILGEFMLPHTVVLHDLNDLRLIINTYQQQGYGKVVSKEDRANGGMGINIWRSLEDLYNQGSYGRLPFPLVIQPFIENSRDIRVIILGEYLEAYYRDNTCNFRNNLHGGGTSTPTEITKDQLQICREVMTRGNFPYAHLDLMITEQGQTFLGEINLRGGIRGAIISTVEYGKRIAAIHESFAENLSLPE